MSSAFLTCSICPNRPSFSDTSHLLTHVSSKGHLFHLHRLQVRGHQDTAAANDLNTYNQWYQDHDVARLLSERLQHKEAKEATKKVASKRRHRVTVSTSRISRTKALAEAQQLSLLPHQPQVGAANYQGNVTNCPSSSERLIRAAAVSATYSSVNLSTQAGHYEVTAHSSSPTSEDADENTFEEVDPALLVSPTTANLKGIVWPSMSMFDAATKIMKKKRNQKKDGFVVHRMQRASSLVRPYETVRSATGVFLKHRHMDKLEDDSPVEGESPAYKPMPKRKKQRSNKKPTKAMTGQVKLEQAWGQQSPLARKQQPPRSSLSTSSNSNSLYSPVEMDEPIPIKLGTPKRQKKIRDFKVHRDDQDGPGVDRSSINLPPVFLEGSDGLIANPLTYWTVPANTWVRPQHQPKQDDNPFKPYRHLQNSYTFDDQLPKMETPLPLAERSANVRSMKVNNPLVCEARSDSVPGPEIHDWHSDIDNHIAASFGTNAEDNYNYPLNPLATALIQMDRQSKYA